MKSVCVCGGVCVGSAVPVVLPGLVERAVGSEAAERPAESGEAQSEEEEHHGQDEEEDEEQGDPDRIGL